MVHMLLHQLHQQCLLLARESDLQGRGTQSGFLIADTGDGAGFLLQVQ